MASSSNLVEAWTKETELSPQSHSATLSLKRMLQKYVKSFINVLPSLEKLEKECEKHVLSLANLLEQRECVECVQEVNVRFISKFPDLKSKLLVKISEEAEKEIAFLRTLLYPLKELQQAMSQAQANILTITSQRGHDLDPVATYDGTATVPSLASMADFIQHVEKESRELYCARMFYLDDISEQSVVTSDNFHDLWQSDSDPTKLFVTIKGCQELVQYFLEEKL